VVDWSVIGLGRFFAAGQERFQFGVSLVHFQKSLIVGLPHPGRSALGIDQVDEVELPGFEAGLHKFHRLSGFRQNPISSVAHLIDGRAVASDGVGPIALQPLLHHLQFRLRDAHIGPRLLLPALPFAAALLTFTGVFTAAEVTLWSRQNFSPGVQPS